MQKAKALKFMLAGLWIDQAVLVLIVGTVEAAAAVPVPAEDGAAEGAVGVERGVPLESVGVPALGVVSVPEGDVPPVMTDPVIGIGVVIRVSVPEAAADVGDAVVEPFPDIFVMENEGLVFPESPNTNPQ